MVKIHGHIKLPPGAVRKGVILGYHWSGPKNLRNFGGYHRTTPQGEYDIDMGDELIRRMQPLFQRPLEVDRSESCWLAFRDVEPHTDDSFYYLGGVAARFLHVVLQGCATVRDWSGSIQVKRGDVFSLNPHALHSAPSDTYCLTACFIVHPRCIK